MLGKCQSQEEEVVPFLYKKTTALKRAVVFHFIVGRFGLFRTHGESEHPVVHCV